MIKFEQLNSDNQIKIRKDALEWYQAHKPHVMKLLSYDNTRFAPEGSDLFRPDLWKAGQWRWFLENSFLL